jgi:sulfite reductase alpha subunit-like flavoprotein
LPAQDFILADELEALQQAGVLSALHVAFSRDEQPADGRTGKYVQHLIERDGPALVELLVGSRRASLSLSADLH